jgi:thymidylate synthase
MLTPKKKLENIFNELYDSNFETAKEAEEFLESEGVEHKKIIAEQLDFILNLHNQTKIQIQKNEGTQFLNQAKEKLKNMVTNAQNLKEVVANLLSGNNQLSFQANFRKLENLNNEDLISMLDEVQILKILSDIEQNNLGKNDNQ